MSHEYKECFLSKKKHKMGNITDGQMFYFLCIYFFYSCDKQWFKKKIKIVLTISGVSRPYVPNNPNYIFFIFFLFLTLYEIVLHNNMHVYNWSKKEHRQSVKNNSFKNVMTSPRKIMWMPYKI